MEPGSRVTEKDVDATVAAVDEALKASGTPVPLKVITGVVRMVLRHTTSQGKLEREYAKLDEEHQMKMLEQLVSDAIVESVEPLAAAALEQFDANERLDGRLDQIVELLYRILSERFDSNASPVINQQINVFGIANIGGPTTQPASVPQGPSAKYEGPGGVPITAVPDFAGRTKELEQLEQALVQHETVCVVAAGIGGIGKTSLARQFVFARAAACFPDGSAWLDARLTQELDRVCRRFGWSDPRELGPEESIAWLARHLHGLRFLLVVDNVGADVDREHVPQPGGRCRTLVTTRERALHDDLDAEQLELDVWSVDESLAYLRARCERLGNVPNSELAPLVEFVGRLPLGVKLLASLMVRRPTLAPADALSNLRAQPVKLLEKYRGQNPGLVATFQSTWEGLEERGRRVLQALAVCARQTRAPVIGPVAGVEDVDEVLDNLHGRSLVEHDTTKAPWRLHDVVRMFVAAQVGREAFEEAHLAWVRAHIDTNADPTAFDNFAAGVAEVRCAFERLLKHDLGQVLEVYRPLVEHSHQVGRYAEVIELSRLLLNSVPPCSLLASAALTYQGMGHQTLGAIREAIDAFEQAVDICDALNYVVGKSVNLSNLGVCYPAVGETAAAIDLHRQALAIEESLGRLEGVAANLLNLGVCCEETDDTGAAIDFLQRSLSIAKALRNLQGQATALSNLGRCYWATGDIPTAIEHHLRAYSIHGSLGNIAGESANLLNLGCCYERLGNIGMAVEMFERSRIIEERLGSLKGQALVLGNLGFIAETDGSPEQARDYFLRTLELLRRMGLPEMHPLIEKHKQALARVDSR